MTISVAWYVSERFARMEKSARRTKKKWKAVAEVFATVEQRRLSIVMA